MSTSRRQFVKQLAAASTAALATPHACGIALEPKTDVARPVIGVGEHTYEADHDWAKLPSQFTWQTTHNVAVDSQGLVYVIHEGRYDQADHPAIFAFDADGNFVRAFGHQFQGGGHGLEVHKEGSDEFLYVTAYQQKRSFAKLTLDGKIVWHKFAPMETGLYAEGEDVVPRAQDDNPWGRNRFHPTNFAFHPDGGFYLADGYGSFRIHRYDADGNWQSMFGKPSDDADASATFDTPHGIWIDSRGDEPQIVIADRANKRLQWFTLEGEHRRTQDGFLLPANIDARGDVLLVPDLVGRVTLLGADNSVIAHLGDDSERMGGEKGGGVRNDESQWLPGKFVHPHDACFDADGNIYVAEWVQRGRVTRLTRKS
jgi:hypothetical protein